MSVIVKNMEMPKNCGECRFCVNGFTDDAPMYECAVQSYENVSVLVESGGKPFDFRPDWCPLIELPPHGRLKDVDRIEYENVYFEDVGESYEIVGKDDIDELPTVIEAEGETDA